MELSELLEAGTIDQVLLDEALEASIDVDLKEFENSLMEGMDSEDSALDLELLQDTLTDEMDEIATMEAYLTEEEELSSLESIIEVLEQYPNLKITLSL